MTCKPHQDREQRITRNKNLMYTGSSLLAGGLIFLISLFSPKLPAEEARLENLRERLTHLEALSTNGDTRLYQAPLDQTRREISDLENSEPVKNYQTTKKHTLYEGFGAAALGLLGMAAGKLYEIRARRNP